MTTTEAFAALMPEPAFQLRWHSVRATYSVSKPNIGDTACFTAAQMRAMFDAATERAAKLVESGPPPLKVEGGRIEIGERARKAFAAAIRAREDGVEG